MVLLMKVKDVASTDVIHVTVPGSREDALRIMKKEDVSVVPVIKNDTNKLVGILTRSDMITNPDEEQIAMLMTRDLITAKMDDDLKTVAEKMVENNTRSGSFEFGVVVISEVGKERGNNLELKEIKKTHDDANQKNDLFNSWLKMCRHSATVDNYPFIKVFTDEQRPESWGADARDLCDIVNIASSGHQRLALPFYSSKGRREQDSNSVLHHRRYAKRVVL